ncbi:hypothetical protein FACS189490_13830 [Clostridia bacterium]|nr:hypothetical protein FACS189490_13830 [Clostridia bacterium]
MGYGLMGFTMFFPFIIVFLFVGVFSFIAISLTKKNAGNRNAPVLIVSALVTGKRQSARQNDGSGFVHYGYFATFEVESGDRIEFSVPENVYAVLAEGDVGKITFQGSKFFSFDRVRDTPAHDTPSRAN